MTASGESPNAALLIIDMQAALVAGAYREREVLDGIAALAERMRAAGRCVLFVQHNHATFKPLMKGEPGWKVHPDLAPHDTDIIIEKTASDAFYRTGLADTLRRRRVDTVLITGMQTEYCVDTTARSALIHGFDVVVVSDCHTTGDSRLRAGQIIDHHNETLGHVVHPTRSIRALPHVKIETRSAP